jgi:hypothetical protein
MYGTLMLPDVLLPKLLDGYPATFERSEGLNDFVVRVNGADRTISREAWCSLLDQTRSGPQRTSDGSKGRGDSHVPPRGLLRGIAAL